MNNVCSVWCSVRARLRFNFSVLPPVSSSATVTSTTTPTTTTTTPTAPRRRNQEERRNNNKKNKNECNPIVLRRNCFCARANGNNNSTLERHTRIAVHVRRGRALKCKLLSDIDRNAADRRWGIEGLLGAYNERESVWFSFFFDFGALSSTCLSVNPFIH